MSRVAATLLGVIALLSSSTALAAGPAYLPGETCSLRAKLGVSVKGRKRKVVLNKGDTIEIVSSKGRFTQVKTPDDVQGLVASKRLLKACKIPRDVCTLKTDVKMKGTLALEGKAFLVKKRTRVILMRYGDKWIDVVAGSMTGQAKRKSLREGCPKLAAKLADETPAGSDAPTPVEEAAPPPAKPQGPEVIVMAFALAKGASAGRAANYFLELKSALSKQRASVAAGGHPAGYVGEPRGLKAHLQESREQAREAGATWMITGRLSSKGGDTLTLARIEVETGKVKGINARPTGKPGDPWATGSASLLLDDLPEEADSAPPPLPDPTPAPVEAPAPAPTPEPVAQAEGGGGLLPILGFSALGAGAVLAGSGAVLGTLALLDRTTFDATPQVADERAALGQRAVGEAIAADALYASGALVGVVGLGLLVTGLLTGGEDDATASEPAPVAAR
jgi:hypothetical protein